MAIGKSVINAAAVASVFLLASLSITGVAAHPLVARDSTSTTIVSSSSSLCLDNKDGGTANGNLQQQWTCTNSDANQRNLPYAPVCCVAQQWTVNSVGNGYYTITNKGSGLCLDNGGVSTNGAALKQWQCYAGLSNQQWSLLPQGDGSYAILSENSGQCLDVKDHSTANGGTIQLWSCAYTSNQRWTLSVPPTSKSFVFGTTKMRGVNMGGWLVLEKWIKPSIFNTYAPNAADEYTFCQTLGKSAAQSALTAHWDTWVTESDIKQLASYGLNFLRIPIGYWALDVSGGEPYVSGLQVDYVKKAITWAAKYGMYVFVDLHGVPGSQNGFDNSGRQGAINWTSGGFSGSNVQRSLKVITQLATILTAAPYGSTVLSIELINEPANWGIDVSVLKEYYTTAYANIRAFTSTNIMIHDAFLDITSYWNGFMQPPAYQNVSLDTHQYQAFASNMKGWSAQQHLDYTCTLKSRVVTSNKNLWTITGEWSLGTISYGASQTGGKSYQNWPSSYKNFLRQFTEKQMDAYEAGGGWVFWNFKIESGYEEWNYMLGVQQGCEYDW
ncbi:glycoside hydrolase superfamily [Jimgerdemannia flammicorona]|uniref:glucan 1,3-beta-glucosidase n=1 Tax=Jimgerdemannia flammicorona TaxID=994334 RepID=A0A433DMN9_9FUNG|nr:glycoside hydrolase superfamily [Jimgerdemannia flammicorona]